MGLESPAKSTYADSSWLFLQFFCTQGTGQDCPTWARHRSVDGHCSSRKVQKDQSLCDLLWRREIPCLEEGVMSQEPWMKTKYTHYSITKYWMKLKLRSIPYPWMRRSNFAKMMIALNWSVGTMFSNFNADLSCSILLLVQGKMDRPVEQNTKGRKGHWAHNRGPQGTKAKRKAFKIAV